MMTLLPASVGITDPQPVLLALVLLVGGLALLLVGAHFLVDRATAMAHQFGVSPLAIGLTVIAFGTSAPELALNVVAAASSEAGARLAFGNVVGSNIANIGLVLAVACLVHPVVAHKSIRYVYWPLLVATEVLLLVLAGTSQEIDWVDGIVLLCSLPVALFILHRLARTQGRAGIEKALEPSWSMNPTTIGMLCLGMVMLLAGAKLAEMGAIDIARAAGLSEAVIGLTVVAVATSLPESFAAILAAKRRQFDLAMGTVIGSNLFNILSVLAITSLVRPVPIPQDVGWDSLISMFIFTLAIGAIYIKKSRIYTRFLGRPNDIGPAGGVTLGRLWGGGMLALWIVVMVYYIVVGEQAGATPGL
jgi:cation:H+ antiporter